MPAERTPDWRYQAACLGLDQDMFFPISDEPRQTLSAKVACAGRPVASPCLEWALHNGADFGIWGGLTGRERRDLAIRRHHQRSLIVRQPHHPRPTSG